MGAQERPRDRHWPCLLGSPLLAPRDGVPWRVARMAPARNRLLRKAWGPASCSRCPPPAPLPLVWPEALARGSEWGTGVWGSCRLSSRVGSGSWMQYPMAPFTKRPSYDEETEVGGTVQHGQHWCLAGRVQYTPAIKVEDQQDDSAC
uniref:Protein tyrosine phosphatase type IVA 3 isoform X3 n=1 Tax=Castor canadensis TaxID=51338 RepID=A0A8B7TY57_CASCN|nr:protein tyrosine phosphatase type IVA 3 isoform X3 [Castor canadensis]